MSPEALAGVLDGVVVLDLTQMLAGPFVTMLLADHGADVIKIEPPQGDLTRELGPFFASDTAKQHSGYFHSINRNKRGIVLDLKSAQDKNIFLKLVREADVVVENYRVGVMERLGLPYEVLRTVNPRLVYATVRGFGDPRTGESPYAEWPAFDIVAQAMGGFMSITGPETPMKAGPGIGDIVPAIFCAFGIVAAVRHAERSGVGQLVDVAMYDAMLAICERIVYQYSIAGVIPTPSGNDHPLLCPFSVYPARDGWVAIACPVDSHWLVLSRAAGRDDLANDARFATNAGRVTYAVEVNAAISAWTTTLTKQELAAVLGGRVPFGPINNVADIMIDPHTHERAAVSQVEIATLGEELALVNTPVKFSLTPGGITTPGPALGAHTREVFAQFGIDN